MISKFIEANAALLAATPLILLFVYTSQGPSAIPTSQEIGNGINTKLTYVKDKSKLMLDMLVNIFSDYSNIKFEKLIITIHSTVNF